jgi:hypothetical protein
MNRRRPAQANPVYLSGMNRDAVRRERPYEVYDEHDSQCVAPIPGRPCLTGLYEHENSAR